jgi:hypothetical protein
LKHAEFIVPWIVQHPEVEASFLLVIPPCSAERFKALNLCLDIVGFQVKVHALFRDLLVVALLEKDSYFRIRKPKFSVDRGACFVHRLVGSAECCGPEGSAFVKVRNVDYEMAHAAAMHDQAPLSDWLDHDGDQGDGDGQ